MAVFDGKNCMSARKVFDALSRFLATYDRVVATSLQLRSQIWLTLYERGQNSETCRIEGTDEASLFRSTRQFRCSFCHDEILRGARMPEINCQLTPYEDVLF